MWRTLRNQAYNRPRRSYWIDWKEEVRRFCKRCKRCNEYFRGQLPHSAPLQPLQFGAPFERVHIDLTGPHPQSRRGSVYIVTIVELFTKWAEAFPVPNKEAATVARVLVEQFFCRFGVGIVLLSDKGGKVDGSLIREICRILDIDKQHTTVSRSRFAGYDAHRGAGRPTGGRPVTSTARSGRSAVCQWWSVRTHVSTYLM